MDHQPANLEELKERIRIYGRKRMAKKVGLTYSQLDRRLNEFTGFRKGEVDRIEAELAAEAMSENK